VADGRASGEELEEDQFVKPPVISVEQVRESGEPCYRCLVPESWADRNGHMNIRYFVVIFDDAGDELYLKIGLTPEFHAAHGTSTFDLEHHTHFLREVKPGDTVAVYVRPVARSAKRMHYLMFLVNETRGNVAAIFECVNSFMDMKVRKTAAYPAELAAQLDVWIATAEKLTWAAPICGAMGA